MIKGHCFTKLLAILCALSPGMAQAACGNPAGFSLPDKDGQIQRPVRRLGDALVFTSGLRVNTDGAANSYHPVGTSAGALNTICNGIAITPKTGKWAGQRITAKAPAAIDRDTRCQMLLDAFRKSRDAGYRIDPEVAIDWYALAMEPPKDGRYRPCIQKQGPYAGFFVARTAAMGDPNANSCDPAHWVSSTEIPYITLPGQRLAPFKVRVGDLAVVHRRVNGADHFVVAVAGDTGNKNELGEGSIALHAALGNATAHRIPGNIGDGVTTFIFPGIRASEPLTLSGLQSRLEPLLRALGGRDAITNCTR